MQQQTNARIGAQLKEKLTQVIATGKLKTVKPVLENAAKRPDPTKPLENALSIISRIQPVQGTIPMDETLRRLNAIRQLVHPFGVPLDERSAKVTEMRRCAEACQNYLGTVAAGIRENDIDASDLPNVANKLNKYVWGVIESVKAYNEKEDPEKPVIDDTLTEAKMRKFGASKQRLVSRIIKSNRVTTYAKMPVLAIFEPAVRTIDLLNAGLPVEGYDGLYSIVLDQHVIGIATEPPGEMTHDMLLQRALRNMSKVRKVRFSVVSDKPTGIAKYGMRFYWVANPQTLARLDNVRGNHVQVATWSFPF